MHEIPICFNRISSIVNLESKDFFIKKPTHPSSLACLILLTHLYPFNTKFSFCFRFVSMHPNIWQSVEYFTSFSNLIFYFTPFTFAYAFFPFLYVIFLFVNLREFFICFEPFFVDIVGIALHNSVLLLFRLPTSLIVVLLSYFFFWLDF